MNDLISRQAAIDAVQQHREGVLGDYEYDEVVAFVYAAAHNHITEVIKRLPSAQPERRWIPVTLETLPSHNSVVVVCGEKGTWDYGTYRGHYEDIHAWNWKKNTIKHVYWWMYKTDALPEPPYREEGGE